MQLAMIAQAITTVDLCQEPVLLPLSKSIAGDIQPTFIQNLHINVWTYIYAWNDVLCSESNCVISCFFSDQT